jgi:hypothetical protein
MEQRLEELVSRYFKESLAQPIEGYRAACQAYDSSPLDFLKDVALYKHLETTLCVRDIINAIEAETLKITPKEVKEKRRREKVEEKQRKKQKGEEDYQKKLKKTCANCQGKSFLFLYSKACDNNSWVLPNGKEGEGYMPNFTNLTDSDGVFMYLCVNCGVPHGFNSNVLKREIEEAEQEQGQHDEEEE